MNLLQGFLRTLVSRPVVAVSSAYLWLTGRKVRARNRLRIAVEQTPAAYQHWIGSVEALERHGALTAPAAACSSSVPRFTFLIHSDSNEVGRILVSLGKIAWPTWEVVIVLRSGSAPLPPKDDVSSALIAPIQTDDAAKALEAALQLSTGDWIIPLPLGVVLPPTVLARYSEAAAAAPGAIVLFGDHDEIDTNGNRSRPWLKPQWNAELFLAQDYISPACAIATEAARAALPLPVYAANCTVFALLLVVTQATTNPHDSKRRSLIVHVPHIQAHLSKVPATPNRPARMAAIARQFPHGIGPALREGPADTIHIRWPELNPPPLVSLIIPTRDNVRLLRNCVESVLAKTLYSMLELLIVDNGSTTRATINYLEKIAIDPRIRILKDDAPFNFSAINNRAAAKARGEYLCLLNDDTEALDPEWLGELLRQAARPHVGAVGARLLYEDGSIQHAGVTVGLGGAAGHAHRFQRSNSAGYFHRADLAHSVSAVTAACLLVSRKKFLAVGGLDENAFAVAFNDVDFCLKLQAAGWLNVYQPTAVLLHHESQSRARDVTPGQIKRYQRELAALRQRWNVEKLTDPLHHPRLDRFSETYVIGI